MSVKLSELLRVGKEVSDVPQSFADPGKTGSKMSEITEAVRAAGGLVDDTDEIKSNPIGSALGMAVGVIVEVIREYAAAGVEIDLFDADGNAIFPPVPASPANPE